MNQQKAPDTEDIDFEQRAKEMHATIKEGFKRSYAAKLANDPEEKELADLSIVHASLAIPPLLKAEEKKLKSLLKIDKIEDDEKKIAQLLTAIQIAAKLTRIWTDILGEHKHAGRVKKLGYSVALALDKIGAGQRTALVPFLDSKDTDLRAMSASVLYETMPERTAPILRDLARSERWLSAGWTAMLSVQWIDRNLPPADQSPTP